MDKDLARMKELKLQGHCCTSIIVAMGLELRGEENEQFVRSVKALCDGMQDGLNCGALTGAVCMLGMFDEKNKEMIKDLVYWFRYELCEKYGSVNCEDITQGDRYNKAMICPGLIQETFAYAKQLLSEHGYINVDEG